LFISLFVAAAMNWRKMTTHGSVISQQRVTNIARTTQTRLVALKRVRAYTRTLSAIAVRMGQRRRSRRAGLSLRRGSPSRN